MGSLEEGFIDDQKNASGQRAKEIFGQLIQKSQQVGDVYSISYESALVLIHDYYRKQVGGIPSLSFLIATRIDPDSQELIDFTQEDSSVLLLRVMDAAALPNAFESERVRVETAQKGRCTYS